MSHRLVARCKGRDIFHDEEGFSTLGVILALLITLSLIFTAAQVYRVESASADIQNVADAGALAAENPVAEFYIVARVCDAVILSLSLTGLAALGLGVAALCVPAATPLSEQLIRAGTEILKARDSFAAKAADGLNSLQKALPFLCAANAAAVVSANSQKTTPRSYVGFAVIFPGTGDEISVGALDAAKDLSRDIKEQKDEIAQAAQKAEEAAKRANAEKLRGFQHDCGNNPNYCMYERAQTLSVLGPTQNPLYGSVDAWNFSVALKRAQAYYPARLIAEAPLDKSVEEQARSALRKRFYTYAAAQVAQGYVHESDVSFDADFPELPQNTEQMRATTLYTDALYPVTENETGKMMHAWSGCPLAGGSTSLGAPAAMDTGGFTECPQCHFAVSSLGKVAAASSSIENGFEYHYAKVADAARAYQKARDAYNPLAENVKGRVGGLWEHFKEAFTQAVVCRISVAPPGRFGALAFVADVAKTPAQQGFESGFVKSDAALGTCVAVSASVLVGNKAEEGSNVISSLLDDVVQQGDALELAFGLDLVLDLWSSFLFAYLRGQDALSEGIERAIDAIPFASESGLGRWAANAFADVVAATGLQPVDLDAPKPVLVNTVHVASADDSALAVRYVSVQNRAVCVSSQSSGDVFSSIIDQLEAAALESLKDFDGTITIAQVEFLGEGGPAIPITIALPEQITSLGTSLLASVAETLRGVVGSITGVRQWE
ncbi:MAG: molybdenum cofactor biosynthesis enzyme [Raoultibacter sp.]